MMYKTKKIIALLLACLLLTACGPKAPDPIQTTAAPAETTEPHSHAYVDGVCLCGDSNLPHRRRLSRDRRREPICSDLHRRG